MQSTGRPAYAIAAVAAVALLVSIAYLWRPAPPAQQVPDLAPPRSSAPPPAPMPTVESKVRYPMDVKSAASPRSQDSFDLQTALAGLFGLNTVQSMFRLDDFARRLAATIDNLGRSHVPAAVWPVNPVAGRFTVEQRDGATFIGADNGLRYTPYVLLLETVDLRQVIAVYTRIYPDLQRAYEDLGYPRGYLNDRLVQVIDELLATPEIDVPLEVRLPSIEGPLQPERPWVLYEFVDPELQSLTAGQKALLRTGSVNERRIKVRLSEIRRLVTAGGSRR